jgi:hypothetical protein
MNEFGTPPMGLEAGPLRKLSTFMCAAIGLTGAATGALMVWLWLSPDLVREFIAPYAMRSDVPVDVSGKTRLVGFAIVAIPTLVLFCILYQGYRLFDAYRKGDFFPQHAPLRLRRIGSGMVALALLRPLAQTLLGLAFTISNPPGQRIVAIGISVEDVMIAIFGGLLIAIGHIMVEANRAARENRSFV